MKKFAVVLAVFSLFFLLKIGVQPAFAAGTFTFTSNMHYARWNHTSTTLQNGKVLVVGGTECLIPNNDGLCSGGGLSKTAELYDPATGTWSDTGSFTIARESHTATLLNDGRVLITGGFGCVLFADDGSCWNNGRVATTEIYDPASGTWSTTGSLTYGRFSHTATLLADGKVLVVGGETNFDGRSASVELYDPTSGIWSSVTDIPHGRVDHTSTLLNNGKVIVVGGDTCIIFNENGCADHGITNISELFDPSTGTWSSTGNLNHQRRQHTATILNNGKVLVAGGAECFSVDIDGRCDNGTPRSSSSELYDPTTGTWSTAGDFTVGRFDHTMTLLANGKVLIAGGNGTGFNSRTTLSVVYDPATGIWSDSDDLNQARFDHSATLLADGKVLITGGDACFTYINGSCATTGLTSSSELYDPNATERQLTTLSPAQLWLGLKSNSDQGIKVDLKAEAYVNNVLVATGEQDSVAIQNMQGDVQTYSIPFASFSPANFPTGSNLSVKFYVRNACTGSEKDSGVVRLWFNAKSVDSHFDATIGGVSNSYYLRSSSVLSNTIANGPKDKIEVQAGAKCSDFKLFDIWSGNF